MLYCAPCQFPYSRKPDVSSKMSDNQQNQLWGGRFSESTDAFVQAFTASVGFDRRMYRQDIQGSQAHATMLAEAGVLTGEERDAIIQGLDEIRAEIEAGEFEWSVALEDVHMNIEARLTDKIGITGKKLHTGRSRNDQVATDIRLWLRDEIDLIDGEMERLMTGLLDQAEREAATIMPGFTHLQTAQPVTFGHHLLAWFEMLKRDRERLADCRKRVNRMPLGAAALAGTTYPIIRERTRELADLLLLQLEDHLQGGDLAARDGVQRQPASELHELQHVRWRPQTQGAAPRPDVVDVRAEGEQRRRRSGVAAAAPEHAPEHACELVE